VNNSVLNELMTHILAKYIISNSQILTLWVSNKVSLLNDSYGKAPKYKL